MDTFVRIVHDLEEPPTTTLSLDFQRRTRARQRVVLDSGEPAALMLKRGELLRGGDCLLAETGRSVRVVAACEPVSTVTCDTAEGLARVAYHLGNRHVALQIGHDFVRYAADHVLDGLVIGLGLEPVASDSPFEPEPGAYAAHRHG